MFVQAVRVNEGTTLFCDGQASTKLVAGDRVIIRRSDHEVLLVENGLVYYRAADQLFSAPINRDGIGTPRLLATDDSVRDAHWAFIKR